MVNNSTSLPYFDELLQQFEQGNADVLKAFGRHVHWGYWQEPTKADGTVTDFAIAAENLCRRVCDAATIKNGDRLLDAGCGFGGTIASLNERFENLQLVGLNIDPRQLARARSEVIPQNNNQIEFVEGNACALPFPDTSFDVVTAVECIFHFPSRADFFREARRVLKTGGKLTICDFVQLEWVLPIINFAGNFFKPPVQGTYGHGDTAITVTDYQNLAKANGFNLCFQEDITVNTLPTYRVVKQLLEQTGQKEIAYVTRLIEWMSYLGLTRYQILSFEAQ